MNPLINAELAALRRQDLSRQARRRIPTATSTTVFRRAPRRGEAW